MNPNNIPLDYNEPNNLSLFLREQGKVIFLNITSYKRIANPGKSGIIIIPDVLSDKQKESLVKLNEDIKDFDEMQIWYDFSSHAQCKNLYSTCKSQVPMILTDYLKEMCDNKTK